MKAIIRDNAEFRIFLPVISNSLLHLFPENARSLAGKYCSLIMELNSMVLHSFSVNGIEPQRTDIYVPGSDNLGLKLRGEEKLELKIKENSQTTEVPGLEYWRKTTLKNRPLTSDKLRQKLLEELEDRTDLHSEGCFILSKARMINVHKTRSKGRGAGRVSQDICVLRAYDNSKPDPSGDAFAPNSLVVNWLTVGFEDNLSYFFSHISEYPLFKQIWRCLLAVMSLLAQFPEHKSVLYDQSFVPMVCGYPMWVNYAYGSDLMPGSSLEQIEKLYGEVDRLLSYLRAQYPALSSELEAVTK